MIYTDFITAIYLGTSRITGIVGKNESGTPIVIAYETEDSAGCIRRGCVYNVKETAAKVKDIIRRMEAKIPGNRIGKVYIGIGGQSIRSLEHTLSKSLETESMITDELIDNLLKECKTCQPEGLDVLDVIPSAYYLDKHAEFDPVGISCSMIEAKYQLIVARPSIRKRIEEISNLAKIEIAEILPTPLVLADIVLTEDDKNRGCALIDFGAGVTSLTTYKNGRLLSLNVIPMGGNLITKDLAYFLGIREADAETLKRKYGNAIVNPDDATTFQVNVEQIDTPAVNLADFNTVLEARLQEILENVYDKLDNAEPKDLRAGIIITGKTANIDNLTTLIYNRLQTDVRYATVRKDVEVKTKLSNITPDGITLGLLLRGKTNCAEQTAIPQAEYAPAPQQTPVPTPPPAPEQTPCEEKQEPTPPQPSTRHGKKKLTDRFSSLMEDIFKDQ
jgi:cell division protein FtsA